MMKDNEVGRHYEEKIKIYEENIRKLKKQETATLEECRKDTSGAAIKLFGLANDMLNLTSNYIVLNGISRSILKLRDEDALTEARKTISKAIIYLENVVGNTFDTALTETDGKLAELSSVSADDKLKIVRKIGVSIALLKAGYGDNTKWRWIFVDIEGRFALITKNLLDLKKAFANNDPSSADYHALNYHLNRVKELLAEVAERYHDRYMLATKRVDDIRYALSFLYALRQMHIMMSERHEAEEVKKKYDAWSSSYDSALKRGQ